MFSNLTFTTTSTNGCAFVVLGIHKWSASYANKEGVGAPSPGTGKTHSRHLSLPDPDTGLSGVYVDTQTPRHTDRNIDIEKMHFDKFLLTLFTF